MSRVSSETTTLLVGFCAKLSKLLLAHADTYNKALSISISFSSRILAGPCELAGLAQAGIYSLNQYPWGKQVLV